MKSGKLKIILSMLLVAVIIWGLYYYISNSLDTPKDEVEIPSSKIEIILANDYPATPVTVVEMFCDITKAFYDEQYTEEQYDKLVEKFRSLLDQELLDNNPEMDHLQALGLEIEGFKGDKRKVMQTQVFGNTLVQQKKEDGSEWATITASFSLREDTTVLNTTENFILRRDDVGKWKVVGWKMAEK